MNIQIIKHNGAPEYAIIPFDEWEKIISRMEEMEDIRDARKISAAIAAGEETFPADFVKRLSSSGAPPAGVEGSFPKRDIPQLAESIQPPAGAGGFLQRGKDRLKAWREYRKLTLAKLAKACGVSIPAISQIENGKRMPSVDLLLKLSQALSCEMEDLI